MSILLEATITRESSKGVGLGNKKTQARNYVQEGKTEI